MIHHCLEKVLNAQHLTVSEASDVMNAIMSGHLTPVQIGGLLIALKSKGETAEEVAGFVQVMRAHAVKIDLADDNAVDGVGTGGDGAHTFNLSTAAGIVAAAAGVTVAKHGNRSISSRCGSADLLEAAGGNIDPGPEIVQANINQLGFGFMFAPRFHPAMKHAAGPRRELGVRTVFNILGPMTNPASVRRQLTGVYSKRIMPLVADVLALTGSVHVMVVHSRDGLDELSISAPTDFIEIKEGRRREGVLTPEDVGLTTHPLDSIRGGDSRRNAAILTELLDGQPTPYRDAVLFSAGTMVYLAGDVDTIAAGVSMAASSIDTGAARELLSRWRQASNA